MRKKKYHEKNREKVNLRNKEYRENNREKESLRGKKYRENNREKINSNRKRVMDYRNTWCGNYRSSIENNLLYIYNDEFTKKK